MTTATLGKRLRTLTNGTTVVQARERRRFAAWLLDWCLLLMVSLAAYAALAAQGPVIALAAALAAWPVGSVAYGFACSYRRTLGQTAAGTRTLRMANGAVPGFWRSAWVMLVRLIFFPFIYVVIITTALGGADPNYGRGDGPKERHLSIDVRETETLEG